MIQSETYGPFSERVHHRVVAEHIPVTGTIEVTRRCPLACSHCYNNLPMGDQTARRAELTLPEHRRILDEIAAAGCLWLLYTGGEIFARPDFPAIYGYARGRGMLITLFTNGTLLTPRLVDLLAEYVPFGIEITLYGRTRETYERLTGVPGSFDRCMRGIELLLERGLPLKLKTVAVSVNRHELPGMKSFAEGLGVEFSYDSMINPRVDCSLSPLAVRLAPHQVVALDLADSARVDAWRDLARRAVGPRFAPQVDGEVYQCGGGVDAFAIDPYGGLSICNLSEKEKFDLRAGSFEEGWGNFLRGVRHRPRTRVTKCTRCQLTVWCGMCPANGELENGHKESPVEFLCEVSHLRAYAFGIEVPEHGECRYCPGGSENERVRWLAAELRHRYSDHGFVREPLPTPHRARDSRVLSLPVLQTA